MNHEAKIEAGKVALDEWSKIYLAPTGVPFELKPTGSTFRGMADLDKAKAYAEEAAQFYRDNGQDRRVFVVQGPTSTTKKPFEVVTATAGYSVLYRTELEQSAEASPARRGPRP